MSTYFAVTVIKQHRHWAMFSDLKLFGSLQVLLEVTYLSKIPPP